MSQSQDLYTLLGLKFNPFTPASNVQDYFYTPESKQILDELYYGIISRKGFLLLLGEVGVGKTSLLLQLLRRIKEDENLETAWIFNTSLDQKEFLKSIVADFGLDLPSQDSLSQLIKVLHGYFLKVNQRGHNCVIIIDEAHNLSFEALESLRMLSNLESDGTKLVQILLTGQPELDNRLKSKELRQLRSRIQLFQTLHPLNQEETANYVYFKLSNAGSHYCIAKKSLRLLYSVTSGNPRMIHLIMDRVLHIVAKQNLGHIPVKFIFRASSEIAEYHYGIKQKLKWHRTKQVCIVCGLVILLFAGSTTMFVWPSSQGNMDLWQVIQKSFIETEVSSSQSCNQGTSIKNSQQKTDKTKTIAKKNNKAASMSEAEGANASSTEIKESDSSKSLAANSTSKIESNRKVLKKFLGMFELQGYLDQLQQAVNQKDVDLFSQALPSEFAVIRLERIPPKKMIQYAALPWEKLTGQKPDWLVLWKPLLQIDKKYPNRSSKQDLLMFQKMLSELGYYSGSWDAQFGQDTYQAMEDFQKAVKIPRTHGPDPKTLFWLCVKYEKFKQQSS